MKHASPHLIHCMHSVTMHATIHQSASFISLNHRQAILHTLLSSNISSADHTADLSQKLWGSNCSKYHFLFFIPIPFSTMILRPRLVKFYMGFLMCSHKSIHICIISKYFQKQGDGSGLPPPGKLKYHSKNYQTSPALRKIQFCCLFHVCR